MIPQFGILAATYAFLYAGGGFVGIFLPLLFQDMGLSPLQIGLIAAVGPISSMIGAPLLGMLADRARSRRKLFIVMSMLCSWALYLLLPFAALYVSVRSVDDAFAISISAIALASAIGVASGSLLDAIAVESLEQNSYGRLRLFGAVGYGVAAGFAGVVMQILQPSTRWLLYVGHFVPNIACNVVALVLVICLRDDPPSPKATPDGAQASSTDSESGPLLKVESDNVAAVAASPRMTRQDMWDFAIFLFVVFLCGNAMGVVNTFLFIFINMLPGGTQLVMGVSVTVTTLFEIPIFFFSTAILNRISIDWALAISLAAYCIRWVCYWLFAVYAQSINAWLILVPESFHGLTFALLWAAIVAKAQSHVKRGTMKSGLAMGLCAGTKGLGGSVGSFASGFALRSNVPIVDVWMTSFFALCGIFLLWTGFATARSVMRCRLSTRAR